MLRHLFSLLPPAWQLVVKQLYYARLIRIGRFRSPEAEWDLLPSLVTRGDWTIDVGANVGHYTLRLAELVGPEGRVLAVEPIPFTFALLAANVIASGQRNVSLLNVAASDVPGLIGMEIPVDHESANYYRAHVSSRAAGLAVAAARLDSLEVPHRVALVKVDAEGHESHVLRGILVVLRRDNPTLILENPDQSVRRLLAELGYGERVLADSPNVVFTHGDAAATRSAIPATRHSTALQRPS